MALADPEALITTWKIPDGRYELTAERHRTLVEHTRGGDTFPTTPGEVAHPIFAHIATHCGKGCTFDELLDNVQARPTDGVVFGGGTFYFIRPLTIGTVYDVRAEISDVVRKRGRRVGTFDAITLTHSLHAADGAEVVRTTESFIVPRERGESDGPATSGRSPGDVASPDGPSWPVGEVVVEDIAAIMELMNDTNPVHLDADLARQAGYRGPVNQGPANLAYVFAALSQWRGSRLGDLRGASFRFLDTVTAGDGLRVRASKNVCAATVVDLSLEIVGTGPALECRLQF